MCVSLHPWSLPVIKPPAQLNTNSTAGRFYTYMTLHTHTHKHTHTQTHTQLTDLIAMLSLSTNSSGAELALFPLDPTSQEVGGS